MTFNKNKKQKSGSLVQKGKGGGVLFGNICIGNERKKKNSSASNITLATSNHHDLFVVVLKATPLWIVGCGYSKFKSYIHLPGGTKIT